MFTLDDAKLRVELIKMLARQNKMDKADDERFALFLDTLQWLREHPADVSVSGMELVNVVLEVE